MAAAVFFCRHCNPSKISDADCSTLSLRYLRAYCGLLETFIAYCGVFFFFKSL